MGGIEVTDLNTFLERETGKVRVDLAHPSWTIFAGGFTHNTLQARLERAFDIVASLVLLALSWPVMLVTILAIKLEEGFSVRCSIARCAWASTASRSSS